MEEFAALLGFEEIEKLYALAVQFALTYSFQILAAIFIFIIGLWVANKVASVVAKLFEKKKIDITLSNFVSNLVKILIVIFVAVVALGKIGISVTPFVAALGAASLGVGLAMQGMLSNFAAGITIIVTRPFAVTNTISVRGVSGIVKEIHLGMTILTNEEGEEISIPNKHIVGEIIHNSFEYMLVDGTIGISYDSQPEQAIKLLKQTLDSIQDVADEPSPQIGINGFGDSSIDIGIRYWVPTKNYFELKYQTNLALYNTLIEAGISIPFPQREVRLLNENSTA